MASHRQWLADTSHVAGAPSALYWPAIAIVAIAIAVVAIAVAGGVAACASRDLCTAVQESDFELECVCCSELGFRQMTAGARSAGAGAASFAGGNGGAGGAAAAGMELELRSEACGHW